MILWNAINLIERSWESPNLLTSLWRASPGASPPLLPLPHLPPLPSPPLLMYLPGWHVHVSTHRRIESDVRMNNKFYGSCTFLIFFFSLSTNSMEIMRIHRLPVGAGLIFLLSTNVFITIEAAIKRGREKRTWWIFDKQLAQCVSKVSSCFFLPLSLFHLFLEPLSRDLCLRWENGFAFMYHDGRWCKILHHVDG